MTVIARASYPLPASGARVVGVRIEQLLAVDLVVGDLLLSFRRNQLVDELLAELLLHVRMLRRVDQHDAVLVEHALVAFTRISRSPLFLKWIQVPRSDST